MSATKCGEEMREDDLVGVIKSISQRNAHLEFKLAKAKQSEMTLLGKIEELTKHKASLKFYSGQKIPQIRAKLERLEKDKMRMRLQSERQLSAHSGIRDKLEAENFELRRENKQLAKAVARSGEEAAPSDLMEFLEMENEVMRHNMSKKRDLLAELAGKLGNVGVQIGLLRREREEVLGELRELSRSVEGAIRECRDRVG